MILRSVLLALLLIATQTQATGAAPALHHPLALYGKRVPLLSGDWLVGGATLTKTDVVGHSLPAPVATIILFQVVGGTVMSFIVIHTNMLATRTGWGISSSCNKTDGYASTPNANSGGDVSCSFAAPVSVGDSGTGDAALTSSAWQNARGLAARRGWRLPTTWLMAGARVGDRGDFLDVRYHFNPQRWGLPDPMLDQAADSSANSWAPPLLALEPSRARLVDALIRWRMVMSTAVEFGLKNRLDPDFALPWPDIGLSDSNPTTDSRKQALDSLRAQGRISDAEYQKQLRQVSGAELEADDNSAQLWLVAVKTVGWRVVVASSVALLSYAFTSSAIIAGGITGVTALTNGMLYFGHELFWRNLNPTDTAILPVIDFAGAAVTQ